MDAGTIIVIVIAAAILGTGVYFQATGKKNIAKAIWVGLGAFVGAMALVFRGKVDRDKIEGQDAIDDSKEQDENRTVVIEEAEDRIEKNKKLLNEINEALGDD